MSRPFLFGVSQYTTWHQTFDEDVKLYSDLGVDAIEVCEFKLDPAQAGEQLARAAAAGLTVTSVQATVHTVFSDALEPAPADPAGRMTLLRQSIERIAPHVPRGTPFILNTGAAPNGDMQRGWEIVTHELRSLADFAAEHGVRLAIEVLNPTDINRATFIWLIPQALALIDQVGRENFGICIDIWNVWQDPRVVDHIRSCGDRIFAVQLSDWRLPRIYSDRYIVGDGEIPFPDLLGAIRSTGYNGAYTVEIFSPDALPDSLWKTDGRQVIGRSLEGVERAWRGTE